MLHNPIDDISILVHVMAWYRRATCRYLSQCSPRYPSPSSLLLHVNYVCFEVLGQSNVLHMNVYKCVGELMMTSSHGNIFRVTGPLCGEFTGQRWIPRTKASNAELWFFYLHQNKRLNKQPWGWWFKTPSRPLWRHYNVSCHFLSHISKCVYSRILLVSMSLINLLSGINKQGPVSPQNSWAHNLNFDDYVLTYKLWANHMMILHMSPYSWHGQHHHQGPYSI